MALNPLNSSNLEQLALKGLKALTVDDAVFKEYVDHRHRLCSLSLC